MITDRDKKRIKALKAEARLAPTQIKFLIVAQWRIGISCIIHPDELVPDDHGGMCTARSIGTQWSFSARLSDIRRGSSEEDWGDLGRICVIVGADPRYSVVPVQDTKPTDVIHWSWLDTPHGTSEPVMISEERMAAYRSSLAKPS